jgi:hypothetical protein
LNDQHCRLVYEPELMTLLARVAPLALRLVAPLFDLARVPLTLQ